MKKAWFVGLVVMALATSAFAGTGDWLFGVSGNGDVFKTAVFNSPTPRTQVGVEFSYFDGIKEDQEQAIAVEFVGKFFALETTELDLVVMKVPTSAYVGVGLGGLWSTVQEEFDDIADARVGFVFGDGPVQIGAEYQMEWTDLMWGGTQSPNHIVLATLTYHFPTKN